MKAQHIITAAAIAAIVVFAAGCKKHSFADGQIRFTASSQPVATRTAYSGEVFSGIERIDWIEGDKVAIAMSNAEGESNCDYRITNVSASSEKSVAQLANIGASGLQWGEGAHTFFALYPSPSVDSDWPNSFSTESLVLSYPAVQTLTPKGESGADALILLPDMKYAYMVAYLSEVEPESTLELKFQPLFTAFEISVSAGDNDEVNLTGFRLISLEENEYLARVKDFYNDENDYDESESISVDLTGIKLTRDGGPLVFTVFAYADGYTHLKLEFTGTEIGTRTLDLVNTTTGEAMHFGGFSKHRIHGLSFPKLDEGGAAGQGINWNGADGEDLNWNGAEGEDINWGGNRPYVLPGKFSVSESKQVQFSRGNLVYKAGEWDFHKQQYDRCFKENCSANFNSGSTFDLFGWATAGIAAADNTMVNYRPWIFNYTPITGQESTNPYGYGPSIENVPGGTNWDEYAEYCDWGSNYGVIQKAGAGWHTLSVAEWTYLFTLRSASEVNGVSNARFAKARVCGEPGLLLFPDDFGTRFTGDHSIFDANSINKLDKDASDFSDIVLSRTDWATAEAAGAVFLPAAGAVVSFFGVSATSGSTIIAYYWSSTAATEVDKAMQIAVGSTVMGGSTMKILYLTGNAIIRGTGCSVRLVKTVE